MSQALHGDCLELMREVPTGSVDMILCDLPYGTTACKWDTIIPFAPLWEQYKRIIKPNGAIVLTASQPFTSALVMSNISWFKHEWIWEKDRASNFLNAKSCPMKYHESVLVFGSGKIVYNPIKTSGHKPTNKSGFRKKVTEVYGFFDNQIQGGHTDRFPKSVQKFNTHNSAHQIVHPTQKPVALFEYLIKTYTNEGETVMDNCAGSGTTAIACLNTNRNYIVMEKEPQYFQTITDRIAKWHEQNTQIKLAI